MNLKKPICCFLIDDDADDREIFSIAIADLEQEITLLTAKDGKEGLEKLEQQTLIPDFIFLDLNMPRINGRQCLVEIRKIEKLSTVPVIIYSTSAQQRDKDETIKLGASLFITKPSSIAILTEILFNVFQPLQNQIRN